MGYRSEVYIKIDKRLEEEFKKILKDTDLDGDWGFKKRDDEDIIANDKGYAITYVKYHADWLKWYSSFPDVKAVNSFIETEDENGMLKGLIAIGEDNATEIHGTPEEVDMYETVIVNW